MSNEDGKNKLGDFALEYAPYIKLAIYKLKNQGVVPSGVEDEDLHLHGYKGILHAIHNYDPKMGNSFKAYAQKSIEGHMRQHLADIDPLKEHRQKAKLAQAGEEDFEKADIKDAIKLGIATTLISAIPYMGTDKTISDHANKDLHHEQAQHVQTEVKPNVSSDLKIKKKKIKKVF